MAVNMIAVVSIVFDLTLAVHVLNWVRDAAGVFQQMNVMDNQTRCRRATTKTIFLVSLFLGHFLELMDVTAAPSFAKRALATTLNTYACPKEKMMRSAYALAVD